MKLLLPYIIICLLLPATCIAQKVLSLKVEGTINPATADYINRGIEKAQKENAECIIIHLNTPGGLLKSTRVIVSNILESPVPVIVFVSPGGAHAGSAGVFITMAAHIAAMAPGTNIGAAHPVSSNGQLDTVMNEKVTNDAIAFIRTIAEKRERNVEWAVEAVQKSVSITENEALRINVINLISPGEKDLLSKIDGKKVTVATGEKTLRTRDADIAAIEMKWFERLLNVVSDPNVAYILFLLGLYGLMFEIYNPGVFFPGIIGGISLVLSLYAMHTLPVSYAGIALIVFAVLLFVLETQLTSHGVLAIGGVISMLLGSLMLIDTDEAWYISGLSLAVIIPAVAVTTLFFLFIVGMGMQAQRTRTTTGQEGMIGKTGDAITALSPSGKVMVHGEIWNAVSHSGTTIAEGSKVKVLSMQNFTLSVDETDSIKKPT